MSEVGIVVSLVAGVVSVILACFAVWLSLVFARESRENSRVTREVLSSIDKTSGITASMIQESHKQLQDTVLSLVKRGGEEQDAVSSDTEAGLRLFQAMIESNPEQSHDLLQTLLQFGALKDQK